MSIGGKEKKLRATFILKCHLKFIEFNNVKINDTPLRSLLCRAAFSSSFTPERVSEERRTLLLRSARGDKR